MRACRAAVVMLGLLWGASASAQTMRLNDGTFATKTVVFGQSGAEASFGSGTQDADDASVATGQSTGLSIGLQHAFDGSVWRRVTFGVAGTASAQVTTIQGIAGMTPVNMICDSGCSGGTTYTHDAALTVGTTVGVPAVGRASAAVPADVSADGDAVLPWHLRSGAGVTAPSFGGVLAVAGNGVSGTGVQRVTIASDSTGVFSGLLANDGVAAGTNRLGTLPVVTETAAPTRTDGRNAALSGTVGGAIRVMVTNAAGTAQSIATDATHDSAASATGPQIMGSGKNTTLPTAVTDGDAVRLLTDLYGRLQPKNICENPELVSSVVISTATSGNVQLVALSGSTVVTVCGFNVVATGTVAVQFISGTGAACATGETDKTGAMPFVANGGINTGFGNKIFAGAAGEAVCIELSAAIQVDGVLSYVQQ